MTTSQCLHKFARLRHSQITFITVAHKNKKKFSNNDKSNHISVTNMTTLNCYFIDKKDL